MSRGGRGRAERLRAPWPAIPWVPAPHAPDEQLRQVVERAAALMADGTCCWYLAAVERAEAEVAQMGERPS